MKFLGFFWDLTIRKDVLLSAVFGDGTAAAPGGDGPAKGLAKGYQEIVIANPVLGRQDLSQGKLRLRWSPGLDPPETVGNSVDMGIYAEAQFAESESHHKIGRFSSYAF